MRFLLVDRIETFEPNSSIRGFKNVAMSEDYLTWHFPEQPIMPGMLILEAFAQLAGWLEAKSSDFQRWALLDRVSSARYYHFCVPGDRVTLELEQLPTDDSSRRSYRGTSSVDGARRAVVEFEAVAVPLEDLDGREQAMRTFGQLNDPQGSATQMATGKGPRS